MQISNRLFPYPVLTIETDDYINNEFTIEYTKIEDIDNVLHISYKLFLNNKAIIKEIQNDNIKIVLHIECAATNYRKLIHLETNEGIIKINNGSVNVTVDTCLMLVANKRMTIESRHFINNDYGDINFNIEKGYILGYYNAGKIEINKDTDELFKPSSIISVVKKLDAVESFDVSLDDSRRIKVILNEETYKQFCQLQNANNLPILHGIIVLPALTYTLERLKIIEERETFSEKVWFKSLEKHLENIGYELDSPKWNNTNSIVIAQQVLHNPVNKALMVLVNEE